MSAETSEELPLTPPSTPVAVPAPSRFAFLRRDPNPIWIRELKQSARLTRTPIILMVVAILMTLVIASIGGTMSTTQSADKVGVTLYHTYFSIAFFLVTWLGPAVAANSIASEREGRTWEAVLLSGLSPKLVARGKFLAALTFISTYIVMLAPVGALAFLFGGVTASEVVIAFVYLFLFAILFVSLGLAISSKMQSLRASILVTLLLVVPLSLGTFGFFGLAVSEPIHQLWQQVPKKLPVWLPTAYMRGDLGPEYVLILVLMPVVLLLLPSWFFYETTIANLKDDNDDRSTGLKRWFLVSAPIVAGTALYAVFIVSPRSVDTVGVFGLVVLALFFAFMVLVFQGEPLGPTRRVRHQREIAKHGAIRSFLGPSAVRTTVLELVVGAALVTGFGALTVGRIPSPSRAEGFVALFTYTTSFFVFVVGMALWLRTRISSTAAARALLVAIVAGIAIVPWVVGAVSGLFAQPSDQGIFIAAPSPIYAFFMLASVGRADQESNLMAGWLCIGGWAIAGIGFLVRGAQRSSTAMAAYDRAIAENDAALAREDEALQAASAPAADESRDDGASETARDGGG